MSEEEDRTIRSLSDQEMRKIALGMVEGNIFTSLSFREGDMSILPQVFMPVALGAFAEYTREELDEIGFLWEDMSEAWNRSINGFPIFWSFHVVNKQDSLVIMEYFNLLREQRGQFLGEEG